MANHLELLGENIASLRKKMGMNQKQFAELNGVSAGTVSQWETGRIDVPYSTQVRIARNGGVSVAALVSGELPESIPMRSPTEEEFTSAFVRRSHVDPKRKALAVLALTAKAEVIETMYASYKTLLPSLEGGSSDDKKPSVG